MGLEWDQLKVGLIMAGFLLPALLPASASQLGLIYNKSGGGGGGGTKSND